MDEAVELAVWDPLKKNKKSEIEPEVVPMQEASTSSQLVEGQDYYLNDDNLMVFTREYHLKRGYCCQSQCRHCPYR